MKIKAILFDKDGTLIDFGATFFNACANIIQYLSRGDLKIAVKLAKAVDFNLESNTCSARSEIVIGTSLTIARLWQPVLKFSCPEQFSRELDRYFDEYTLPSVTAFEFTLPTLLKLHAMGIILGVATNDSEYNAHQHLCAIGIEDMFSFIVGYDSGHGAKPEPDMVIEFSRQTGCSVKELAMVGDSVNDLLAGKEAGAWAIAVTSGIAGNSELCPYADYVVEDISQLPKLLVQAVY